MSRLVWVRSAVVLVNDATEKSALVFTVTALKMVAASCP